MNRLKTTYGKMNRLLAAGAAALLLLAACDKKELCYEHPHNALVQVEFDWKEAPKANPATMSLYLFPDDGAEPMRYEFTDRAGGTISVPYGVYDAVCLNSDQETHRLVNKERVETFEVTTHSTRTLQGVLRSKSDTAPLARGAEEERSVQEPDSLWTAHTERITVLPDAEGQRLVMAPRSRVIACTVEVRNVENFSQAQAISASVTGMAGGWMPGIDRLTDEKVTIPFEVEANADKTVLTARLSFFGHCPGAKGRHKVMIYAQMTDGNTYFYEEDVTDQLHDPKQEPNHIKIVLEKLPLPKPVTGGGLQPTVKDWKEVYINLPMN